MSDYQFFNNLIFTNGLPQSSYEPTLSKQDALNLPHDFWRDIPNMRIFHDIKVLTHSTKLALHLKCTYVRMLMCINCLQSKQVYK